MGKLSPELRKTIVELNKKGHKPKSIVKLLPERVSEISVYKLLQKYKATGSTKDIKIRRVTKITPEISDFIEEIYRKNRYHFKLIGI